MRGLFVTFEGIDRSGKTTQAGLLVDALGEAALGVREPGGTPAGERLRDLLKDAEIDLAPETEALLFAAARSELVANVILPALDTGQGRGVRPLPRLVPGLPGRRARARHRRRRARESVRHPGAEARPDVPFGSVRPTTRPRARGRATASRTRGRELQAAVGAAYEHLIEADPDRWRRIDATRSPDEVHADVLAAVEAARG